jgi:hypothetical protein
MQRSALPRYFWMTQAVKRSWWLLGVGAICVVVVLVVLFARDHWLLPIDQGACDQVQPGMSLAEVEGILGGPPGNYTGLFFKHDVSIPLTVAGSTSRKQWTGTRGVLIVFLDERDRVISSMYFPPP